MCTGQAQTQDPGLLNNMHLAFRVGYSKDLHDVTLSWGQSPLVSPRQRGGGWLSEQCKDKQEKEKCRLADGFAAAVCACVWMQKPSIYIHVRQLIQSYVHVCLMCMSMPSCSACQDNGRQCTAAEHNDTVITDSTPTLYRFYMYWNKGLVPTSMLPSLNDAMQLPSAIQGNNTPTALSAILSPVSFTVIIITPPPELQS